VGITEAAYADEVLARRTRFCPYQAGLCGLQRSGGPHVPAKQKPPPLSGPERSEGALNGETLPRRAVKIYELSSRGATG